MIEELQRFVQVSKEGNVTKTAEKLFLTQSALTQSIKRLETAIGTKLFSQKGKYLQLTLDGKAVFAISNKMLQHWENMKDPSIRNTNQTTYSIGLFDNAALRLGKYFQPHLTSSETRLELIIDSSGKLFKQLHWGLLDVAICVVDKKSTLPSNIVLIKTFNEELIPVSSRKFGKNLNDIPFILYNEISHTRTQIDMVFAQAEIKPKIFAESTSTTFMRELAGLGGGVALLPKNFVAQDIKQKTLIKQKLPITWQREFGVYLNTQSDIKETNPFLKGILEALEKA
jgi:LysR family transcriptional activator of nhaA